MEFEYETDRTQVFEYSFSSDLQWPLTQISGPGHYDYSTLNVSETVEKVEY